MSQLPDQSPEAASPETAPEVEEAGSYHLIGQREENERRGIFHVSLGVLAVVVAYFAVNSKVEDILHLYLGLTILVLATLPMIFWLRTGGAHFPVFEPIMLLCVGAYALPLLAGHEFVGMFPAETITLAGFSVVIYQLSAIAAYFLMRGLPGRSAFWHDTVLTPQLARLVPYGLVLSGVYIGISTFTTWVPGELESVLRAVFYGVGILATFVTFQRWGRNELTPGEKALFGTMFVLQLIFMAATLLLIGIISQVGIGLLGYLSSGRRVPWVTLVLTFFCLAILHNGKSQMRTLYWTPEYQSIPRITELPGFFSKWFAYGTQSPLVGTSKDSASAKLIERTSLFHILCLVAYQSPDRQPYLMGETYGNVLPQLIPRFFWSAKPRSHVSTYRLSTYYGLQDEDATQTTTIAFGMLTEAYANFGLVGCILLGLVQGAVFKKLHTLSVQSPLFSFAGLMMILFTAWSFNSELTMAAWVSSLYQALIIVLGLPFLLRGFLGF